MDSAGADLGGGGGIGLPADPKGPPLYYLHKQSLCDSMNSLFFQPKSQIFVFILKVFILITNQLLSTATA